jgi:hypothetical protein
LGRYSEKKERKENEVKKKMKNGDKKRTIDILKRKLLKLGIYSAPIILSISIPDIKIQAQTGNPGCPPLLAPPIRKNSITEQEKDKNEKDHNKKRIRIKSIYELYKNPFKSPFKKSPFGRKKEEEK